MRRPPGFADDSAAMRDRVASAVSGLLALAGVEADPIQSREHILLSNIVDREWRAGKNLDLLAVIQAVQEPGMDRIGVLPLESFFPAKDRFALAMLLNNLAASPSFTAWTEGEPLNIQRLLYTREGRPRVSILSISHLSDAERMFFVTVLLNEVLAWTRRQTGTSTLRALLYMDEIFGYFPPTANPPGQGADADPAEAGPRLRTRALCFPPRIPSISTIADCPIRAPGSSAACKPSATRCGSSKASRAPRQGRGSTRPRWII